MKSGAHTFARLVAWSVLLLGLTVGCGSGCGPDPLPPPAQREMPDADASSVEASKSQAIRATGKDVVDIKVTVRKADGTPLVGRTVKVTVSGEAVTVVQPTGPTDAQGVASAKVTSTAAGIKTVTASVEAQGGPVALSSRPTLEFIVLPASRLAFTTSPRMGTAGAALGVFEVTIQNGDGETVTGATNTVTVARGSGPAAASLKGTVSVAAVNGVARFSTLVLEQAAQGYTLTASASGLAGATSPAFEVTSAAPASLVVAQVPASVTAGSSLSPEVSVRDAFGNVVTGYTGTVRFSSDDAAASLPSDYAFTSAGAGRHVFTGGLVLKKAGARRVTVTDQAQSTLAATSEVGVVPASAATLVFTGQPGDHSVRSPFGVQVALLDAFGNRVTASGVVVTLGLNKSGTLVGLVPATTVDGVASFSDLSIASDDSGYVLTASADGLTAGPSNAFTITDDVAPAAPVLEELATTASTITVGWKAVGDDGMLGEASRYDLRYSTSPIVSDADFEAATPVKQVTTAFPVGTNDSAKISGLVPNTTYYVALVVKDNVGNAVRATRPVSTPYPTASKLAFLDQPSNKTAGSTQAPLRVAIQDVDGLLVTNASSVVTLTVQGVTGFGPFIATADKGVATFSDVRIDTAGKGYTLKATSGSLTPDTSNPFDIQHASASRLTLTAAASKVSSGTPTRATVTVFDAYGNVAEGYTGSVTLSSSDTAATLPEAHVFTAADMGRFTFENITLLTAGMQTLTASADGLTASTVELEVLPRKLLLTGLPAMMKAGDSATVTVEVLDGFGVRDSGYRGTVRFTSSDSKAEQLPDYGFTAADMGLKTFTVRFVSLGDQTLTVQDKAMATLSATASTRVKWGDTVKLVLEAPEAVVAGDVFSARVTALDGLGYTVEDYAGTVSFSSTETGSTVPEVYAFTPEDKGSRAFSFTLKKAVSTELAVLDAALSLRATDTVVVSHAPASRLVLAFVPAHTEPVIAGTGLTVEVTAKDAYGNVATGYAGTVRFESNDLQAVLPGETSFAGAEGRKSFPVTLKTAGERSVSAKDTVALLMSEGASVRIVPGPASKLALSMLSVAAPKVSSGAPNSAAVAVLDAYGNVAEGYTGTVALSSSDTAATLPEAHVFTATDMGRFTFENITLLTAGMQSLTASADGLTASTVELEVLPRKLLLTGLPAMMKAGDSATVTVEVLDGFGVRDSGYRGTVRFTSSDAKAEPLPDYTFTAADMGLKAFTVRFVSLGDQTLTVQDKAMATLSVTASTRVKWGDAVKLVFEAPEAVVAGNSFTAQVTVLDGLGYTVEDYTGTVSFSSTEMGSTVPGNYTFTLADKGSRPFSFKLEKAVSTEMAVTDPALSLSATDTVAVSHAPASRLMLLAEAAQVSSGTPTRALVAVVDAYGNLAEDYTGTVALSSSDTAATLPEAHAFIATDMGRFTFESITLLTAGMQSLTASADGLTAGTVMVEVLPRTLRLTDLPATMKAGDSALVMVEVLDGFGVRDTGYTGTVRFTSSDSKAGLPSEYTFTAADLGFKAFTVRFVSLGEQTLTVRDTAMATLSVTASTRVKWGDAVKLVFEAPEAVVAGDVFSARVTALDGLGYTVEDYTGTVSFSSLEMGATVPEVYTFTAEDKGSRAFSFKLERAVSTELAVMDVALSLNATDTVSVSHAPASRLVLAFVPAPTEPVTAGTGLTVEVTAKDAYGNVATGYAGTVRFESNDLQAVLPGETSFAGAGGRKSFPVTLKTAGDQAVSAKDTVAFLMSEGASVRIVPGPASKLAFRAPPTGGKVRTALAPVTVAITDLYGNTVAVDAPELTVWLVDGNPDAVLGGTTTVTPSGGLATFSTLTVDQQGVGFRLEVMGGPFDVLSSEPFGIEDNLAPEAPLLSWDNTTSTQLELRWYAVADDGVLGPAAVSYDLRYSTSPITEATFASATSVDAGWPQSPGAQESVLVTGLTPSTTYYFALKVMDDAGNLSALSTLSTATNVDPCAGYSCPVSAPFCEADGVTRTSYTATCVDVNNAPSCGAETPTATLCPGTDGVCFKGACGTAPKPGAGSLSISEVMHSPSSGTTEYIELTNNTGTLLNLNGLTLSYTLGSGTEAGSVTVGSGAVPVVVEGKGTFVLARNMDLGTNGGVPANVAYGSDITLEDSGTLKLAQGTTTVEFFSYTTAFPRTTGRSMNLSSLVVGTKANAHRWYWCDSSAPLSGGDFGTPNAPNSDCGIAPAAPVDYCAIQYPKTFPSGDGNYPATVTPGSSWTIYSQFYEPGLTDRNTTGNDNYPHVVAELGYGTDSTNPAGWTWTSAAANLGYNSAFSNNDEVLATLTIPTVGTYKYGFRYRLRDPATGNWSPYTYCDQSGATTPPAGSYGTVTVANPPPPVLTNHLVISELSHGTTANPNDEFVELHNPTNTEVSLSNWKLQYRGAAGAAYSLTYTFSIGAKIPARGYYLLALSGTGYSGPIADASYTLAMGAAGGHVRLVQADNTTVVDTVGYGTAIAPEGSPITGTLGTSGSYERKAVSTSTAATMAVGGSDATRGNGYDSNNNANDFVVRSTRQPQNSASATEVP